MCHLAAMDGIAKVRYTHEDMIATLIANPLISQNELALRYGYSAAWVSRIMTSDSFQARLHEKSAEYLDPVIRASVQERFKALVSRSLEILEEKLNRPSEAIPDQFALRTFELGTRAAGYGARTDTSPAIQQNVNVYLQQHGEQLVGLLRRKKAEVLLEDLSDESPN
jgi:hypothetical protein